MLDAIFQKYSHTEGQRNEIDDVMGLILFVQRILGQQILEPDWTWKRYFRNHIVVISLIIYVILGTVNVLVNAPDVESIAEGYYTIIINCVFPIKYLFFINNRNLFRKLYKVAKTTFFNLIKEDVERGVELLKMCRNLRLILFTMTLFPVVIYLLLALYNYVIGTRVTLSKTTSILMPMTSPFYEIGLLIHTVYFTGISFTYLVIDVWFVFLTYFYCMACDSLCRILMIEKKPEESTELYEKRLSKSLRRFHHIHKSNTIYLGDLNKMFKWASTVPLCNVLICLCILLFMMSEKINWTFASNIVPTCAELFAYNWFGEQIKIKAIKLHMAILEFDWLSMTMCDKKKYLIILTYMNKEFGIKSALGYELSLLTMSTVLKASYQAVAVLKSMDK